MTTLTIKINPFIISPVEFHSFNSLITEASLLKIKIPQMPHESTILLSPVFPPPPDYNNDKASPFFESCKVKIRNNNICEIEHIQI